MFSLICAWINDWVNNLEAGDLRRHVAHYDVTVMFNSKEDIMLKVSYNGVDVAGAIVISTMHENMMMMMMKITRLPVTIITLYAWVTEHVPSSDTHRAICNCLLNRLFRHRSKKTSKLPVTGLCDGKSLVTGEFPHKGPVTRKMLPFDDVMMACGLNAIILLSHFSCPFGTWFKVQVCVHCVPSLSLITSYSHYICIMYIFEWWQ